MTTGRTWRITAGSALAAVGAAALLLTTVGTGDGWIIAALVISVAAILGSGWVLAQADVPSLLVMAISCATLGVGFLAWSWLWGALYLGAAVVLAVVWQLRRRTRQRWEGTGVRGSGTVLQGPPHRHRSSTIPVLRQLSSGSQVEPRDGQAPRCTSIDDDELLKLASVRHADRMTDAELRAALPKVPGWDDAFVTTFHGYLRRAPNLALTIWNLAGAVHDEVLTRKQFDDTVRTELTWRERH